jgi:hypothetical protein
MKISPVILLIASTSLIGCASVTGTTGQSVSVIARQSNGSAVVGASCELSNAKGKWYTNTPGSIAIRRSNDDLTVLCSKDGLEPGMATVSSETKGSMWGNVLLGGGIGAVVDHNSGAAYEYPTLIQVMMGKNIKIEPPKLEKDTGSSSGQSTTLSTNQVPSNKTPTKLSPAQRLKDLNELKNKGLINDSEYESKRAEILQSM